MKNLSTPLHVAETAFGRLRLFRSPHQDPDLPWPSVDDLMQALGMDETMRTHTLRAVQRDWGKHIRTVATAEGIVAICPHFAAQGLLEAWIEEGLADEALQNAYHSAGMKASKQLTMGMATHDRMAFMFAALARATD